MTSKLSCSTLLSFYPRRSLGSNISRQAFTPSQSEDPNFSRQALDSSTVTFDGSNTSFAGLKQGKPAVDKQYNQASFNDGDTF